MTRHAVREVEHEIIVHAPAADVYRLLAQVENWPQIFPPSVYVDYLDRDGNQEQIRIWALANGVVKNWTSRRRLDPESLRIEFRQEVSTPPVAAMSGKWIIEPLSDRETRLRLLHEYRAVGDDPVGLAWIEQAVDRNSRAELGSLKTTMELATGPEELTLSFQDSVRIEGSAKDVYDFINEAQHWTERLPHVAEVHLTETTPGLQVLRMQTLTKDGSAHTTESVRVCFPYHRIAYKQTRLPALMTLHTGYWQLDEDTDGVTTVISQHTVTVNTENIAKILGSEAGIPEARAFLRTALSGNSRATLEHAKRYAEARR
jgi:aromatase